jgi:SPP1 family predicted phage head-tail adaptor
MRDFCNVLQASKVSDGEGGFTLSYTSRYDDVPCLIDNRGNSRELETLAVAYNKSLVVYFRYLDGIVNTDKIEFDGVQYTIHSITNIDQKNRFLEITCYA